MNMNYIKLISLHFISTFIFISALRKANSLPIVILYLSCPSASNFVVTPRQATL